MAPPAQRYVVDEHGNRVAVLLDIAEYERLLEELGERASTLASDAAKAVTGSVGAGVGIIHHPKLPDANPERLREVMGVLSLKEPVQPRSWRLLDDDEDDVRPANNDARH